VRTKLKKLRLLAGKTQAGVADAVGTSQPNYQRWESEKAKIPHSKIKKLANVLGVTEQEILGEIKPFDLFGINKVIEDERTYYGEVTFHFFEGDPLIFPVSEEERTRIHHQLDSGVFFISTRSLDNKLVFVRREAITDLYISSEAYDTFGPEDYKDYIGVAPDDNFWLAVEHIDRGENEYYISDYPDELDEEYVNKVFKEIVLTNEQLKDLIADGALEESEKDRVREDSNRKTEALLLRAKFVTWQISNGVLRREPVIEPEALVNGFYSIDLGCTDEEEVIQIPFEGYHRTVLINKKAIDYLSIPAHIYDAASLDEVEKELDE